MDIFAHALWAGTGVIAARHRWTISTRTLVLTVTLAALPDVLHMLPIIAWAIAGSGRMEIVQAYAMAIPGGEPALPPIVTLLSHHLHCIMHSALVTGAVTLVLWSVIGELWIPLLGWWSHVLVDVVTHSTDFYPSPVLYPITEQGFDGLAWNTPWFVVLNYTALGVSMLWLFFTRRHPSTDIRASK